MTQDFAKLPGIMPDFKALRYKSMDQIMRGGIEQIPLVLGGKEETRLCWAGPAEMVRFGHTDRSSRLFEVNQTDPENRRRRRLPNSK
jgi:hypothetical protein